MVTGGLMQPEEVAALIAAGRPLLLSGDEALLAALPHGRWIGGTMPVFMVDGQRVLSRDRLFVNELPAEASAVTIRDYDEQTLPRIVAQAPANGFSALLIPAFSALHVAYAERVYEYDGLFNTPLVGWISGVAMDEVGQRAPKVFNGLTGAASERRGVAAHVSLPPHLAARVHIANPFQAGGGGILAFGQAGFEARDCTVDGRPTPLLRYIREAGIDQELPLVADCFGTPVNVSIQSVEEETGTVRFYAPVFPHLRYRFAAPEPGALPHAHHNIRPALACHCIRNPPSRPVVGFPGPMTFGEIAYVLLNQTVVYLTIDPVA